MLDSGNRERGGFVPSPSGRFVQPRVPFAISGTSPRPFGDAPGNGEHTQSFVWAEPTPRRPTRRRP